MSNLIGHEVVSEWFVAKITEVGTPANVGDGTPHAWTTLKPLDNYSKYDTTVDPYYPRKFGTTTINPAYALDGTASTVGTVVMMRYRAAPDGMSVMEFIKSGGGGGPENCPRVSNVTCTANMLVVTYQLVCEEVPEPELQGNCPVGAPVGSILMWTQEPIPTGWLECNGGTFDPLDYPELFDLYGNNNLPDLRSAFIRGRGASAGALNPFGASNYPFKTARPSGASPFTTNTVARASVCLVFVFDGLTLAELGTATSTMETVFFAFLHTGISSQVSIVTQRLEIRFVVAAQRPSDRHPNCT